MYLSDFASMPSRSPEFVICAVKVNMKRGRNWKIHKDLIVLLKSGQSNWSNLQKAVSEAFTSHASPLA